MPDMEVTCKDCGETFTVEEGELNFLRDKFGDDLKAPVRCKSCRKKKKERNAQPNNTQMRDQLRDQLPPDDSTRPGRRKRKGKGKRRRGDRYQEY